MAGNRTCEAQCDKAVFAALLRDKALRGFPLGCSTQQAFKSMEQFGSRNAVSQVRPGCINQSCQPIDPCEMSIWFERSCRTPPTRYPFEHFGAGDLIGQMRPVAMDFAGDAIQLGRDDQ